VPIRRKTMSKSASAGRAYSWTCLSVLTLAAIPGCGGNADPLGSSHAAVSGSATLYGYTTAGSLSAQTAGNFARLGYDANDAVENNDWGIPQNGQGSSTSFLETINGSRAFGWAWNVYNGTNVAIYPEVGYGWSPNGNASWGGSPMIPQLSARQAITLDFNIIGQHSPNGTWDMAFDIWITSAQHPANTVGSFELMIWLDHNQNAPWSTEGPQGLVTIGGVTYQRYTNAGAANWTCLTYINQGAGIYNGAGFNISDVIYDAAAKFGIPANDYVASIEFGNEAVNGSGMTEIANWSVTIGSGAGAGPGSGPPVSGPAPNFELNSWQSSQRSGVTVWNGGVGNFAPGNWIEFNAVDLSNGYNNFAISYATALAGSFDVRIDNPNGVALCTVWTAPTGGWGNYAWGGCNLNASLARGTHDLYLVATSGASNLGTMWVKNM
jgi:hypothetical protein